MVVRFRRLSRAPTANDDAAVSRAAPDPAATTTTPGDDDEIVLRALVDRRAFAPLYERYVETIFRHCHRHLRDRETAEDLTALVFRKALERLHLYRGGAFKAWLFTLADHALIDDARARHTRRFTTLLTDDDEWQDTAPGPEDRAIDALDRQRLNQALDRLPDEWRRVVHLRAEGFSCAEVAAMLGHGRSVAWVRQTHRRAFLRLRELLGDDDQPKGGAR